MEQAEANAEYAMEEMKKKVKRQRSYIAFLCCTVLIFTIIYFS